MGPYVLRSVGAHFKLWDESVQDSFTEKLTQVPVNNVPNIPLNCNCTTTAGSCGSSTSLCAGNQREYEHTCSIQGCDGAPASSCQPDSACCTAWASTGCGTIPLGQPATSTNCNYGYQIQSKQCGSGTSIQCVQNASCPKPTCLGILSPGALYCTTHSTTVPANLTQNYGISYVSDCKNAPPCSLYCPLPYFLNPTGTACSRTFEVALSESSTSNCQSGCTCKQSGNIITNDCSFKICVTTPPTTITAVSVTDVSSTKTSPYCNSPAGNPGEECQVSVSY